MKEVTIEYNDVLPAFYCGLTAFSNLLQQTKQTLQIFISCGLTAFSNLLQLTIVVASRPPSCALPPFSNLLQLKFSSWYRKLQLRLDRIF